MNVSLIFDHWQSPYQEGLPRELTAEEDTELSSGPFHGGSTWPGIIALPDYQAEELAEAMAKGYTPVFLIAKGGVS